MKDSVRFLLRDASDELVEIRLLEKPFALKI